MEWLAQIIVIGLAVARITSLIVQDDLLEPIRHRVFTASPPTADDSHPLAFYRYIETRWGRRVPGLLRDEPRAAGFWGRLLSCYHCVGVWVSIVAAAAFYSQPAASWPILVVFAIAQISDTAIRGARPHGS